MKGGLFLTNKEIITILEEINTVRKLSKDGWELIDKLESHLESEKNTE